MRWDACLEVWETIKQKGSVGLRKKMYYFAQSSSIMELITQDKM